MLSAELVYVFVSFTAFLTFVVIGRSTIVSIPVRPPAVTTALRFSVLDQFTCIFIILINLKGKTLKTFSAFYLSKLF